MRLVHAVAIGVTLGLLASAAQSSAQGMDPDRVVPGGGISVPGWKGTIDPASVKQGRTINDSKFAKEGDALHMEVGPAAIYWNPANTMSGDYTVKATFKEAKPTASHPHPAGIFIGGKDPGTDTQSLMYCTAYSDGTFLIRQFTGATVATLAKRQPNAAVHKAGADGSVTQEVGWTVKGGRAECIINGTSVAGFNKDEMVGTAKVASTDGIYGLRVSHNMDVMVTGLSASKN